MEDERKADRPPPYQPLDMKPGQAHYLIRLRRRRKAPKILTICECPQFA